jgi:hypothetical protein
MVDGVNHLRIDYAALRSILVESNLALLQPRIDRLLTASFCQQFLRPRYDKTRAGTT